MFTVVLLILNALLPQNTEHLLNSGWKFQQAGKAEWMDARVPGSVYTDLYLNKKIGHPYKGTNEKELQWIEKENWNYQCVFALSAKELKKDGILLEFEGLDTYAEVLVNGKTILFTNNMFRTWSAEVKDLLTAGNNTLSIHFEPTAKKANELKEKNKITLPGEERVFVRKAQYQFGWDFGPRFVGCGIWKNVRLISYNDARVKDLQCRQKYLSDSLAKVSIKLEVQCKTKGEYEFIIRRYQTPKDIHIKRELDAGLNKIEIDHEIKDPQLWYCNGSGKQAMYDFTLTLKNKRILDIKEFSTGLRKTELIQKKDSIGESFLFKLNGKEIFMKGANYIPNDVLEPGMHFDRTKVLIQECKRSGFNMIRVWGGGIYESEEFYKECDRNGIMVWQDLPFACAMYPGDSSFIENVKTEVKENANRIASHPCIALWCGNNENDEGWKNWGWQKQYKYKAEDSLKIATDYQRLFHELLPAEIKEADENANYHASSPLFGWGRKESLTNGDAHYWGVWWAKEPYENYKNKTGRFMSEYGMQALPVLSTVLSFCTDSNCNLSSPSMKMHQKHPVGFETIDHYLTNYYTKTDSLEKYIYLSQLLQRDAMKIGIESHRIAKPKCMGTLFWQLNDCWPGISWSVLDYNNKGKAAFFQLKELYLNILPVIEERDSLIYFHLVSDSLNGFGGEYKIKLLDLDGNILMERKNKAYIQANSSTVQFAMEKRWLKDFDLTKAYLLYEFKYNGKTIKRIQFLKHIREIQLPDLKIKYHVDYRNSCIHIKAGSFVKDLQISLNKGEVKLSDNYFDMQKGESKIIRILSDTFDPKSLKFYSLNQCKLK